MRLREKGHTHHGYSCAKRTNTQTADEPTNGILLPYIGRGDLNNDAYGEDDTLCTHGITTTKKVCRST